MTGMVGSGDGYADDPVARVAVEPRAQLDPANPLYRPAGAVSVASRRGAHARTRRALEPQAGGGQVRDGFRIWSKWDTQPADWSEPKP